MSVIEIFLIQKIFKLYLVTPTTLEQTKSMVQESRRMTAGTEKNSRNSHYSSKVTTVIIIKIKAKVIILG